MESLERRKIKIEKLAKSGDKEARSQMEVIKKLIRSINENIPARAVNGFSEEDKKFLKSLTLLTDNWTPYPFSRTIEIFFS